MSYTISRPSGAEQRIPSSATEPTWAPPLLAACATLARSRPDEIRTIHVVVTLAGERADPGDLLAFSQAVAARHGMGAEVEGFAPPTFAVRFSRGGPAAPRAEGADA